MAIEIERKFLINPKKLPKLPNKKQIIKQGYFKSNQATIRIRLSNDKAILTIKGKSNGLSRSEFEYEIPYKDGLQMQEEFCKDRFVEKTRYLIEYKNNIWELDIFEGKNKGLIMAEIEMPSEKHKFEKPDWITKEVSLDGNYNNSKLAKNPYIYWNETQTHNKT